MQVYNNIPQINISGDSALVIGKFAGLHLGHRKLVRDMVSGSPGLNHCVLMVRFPGGDDLITRQELERRLERMGVDYLICLDLDERLMAMEAEAFLNDIMLDLIHMKKLYAGEDVTFGKDAAGNADFLRCRQQAYGYTLFLIPKVNFEGEPISSSRIRAALASGETRKAMIMLGQKPNTASDGDLNGLIIIDKPAGFTSQDVISKLRGILHQKRMGHTGTLDPAATGVLPVLLGTATGLSDLLMSGTKTYEATMILGVTTDTQDMEGRILETRTVCLSNDDILRGVKHLTGEIQQIPPMYSAIKINGQKLCDLARKGREVERKPRTITIYDIEILDIDMPEVRLRITCSKGTYIRTLCHDIGQYLGCGAAVKTLRRTASGRFRIENAVTLEALQAVADNCEDPTAYILSPEQILGDLPEFRVREEYDKALHNGNAIAPDMGTGAATEGPVRMYDSTGNLTGLFEMKEGKFRPLVMLRITQKCEK